MGKIDFSKGSYSWEGWESLSIEEYAVQTWFIHETPVKDAFKELESTEQSNFDTMD